MANMKEVNKAIKQKFKDHNIEAVRGSGYVWFDCDYNIPSVYINPVSTKTEDVIKFALLEIQDYFDNN